MEAISLIMAALLAGTSTGIGSVVADAIKGVYGEFRKTLKRKLAHDPEAEAALADPAAHEELLRTALWKAGADRDETIMSAAKTIVERVDPAAAARYEVSINNSENIQVGNGNTMHSVTHRNIG